MAFIRAIGTADISSRSEFHAIDSLSCPTSATSLLVLKKPRLSGNAAGECIRRFHSKRRFHYRPFPQPAFASAEFSPNAADAADPTARFLPVSDIGELTRLLHSEDKKNRMLALCFLRDIEPPEVAVAALKTVLRDPDVFIRQTAAFNLGFKKTDESLNLLRTVLESDPDYSVRAAAANALGFLEDPRAFDVLVRTFYEDTEWIVVFTAATSLGCLKDPRAIPVLLKALEKDNGLTNQAAVAGLGELGALEAIPHFVRFLESNDYLLRQKIAEALGKLPCSAALEILRRMRWDTHPHVREAAELSFNNLIKNTDINLLARSIPNQSFRGLNDANDVTGTGDTLASGLLKEIAKRRASKGWAPEPVFGENEEKPKSPPPPKTLEEIDAALKSLDMKERLRGIVSLTNAPPEDASKLVLENKSYKDQSELIRSAAALIIGQTPGNLELLDSLLRDESPTVRSSACDSLSEPHYRETSLDLVLRTYHRDPNWMVRCSSLIALGTSGNPAALDTLLKAVDTEDILHKRYAIIALGLLGDVGGIDKLVTFITEEDPLTRFRLATSLAKFEDPRSIDALRKLSEDENENVRAAANKALQQLGSL
mmetsp:Transcript_54330/g.90311  ORF Transcript_54330/g.90311 Transcript_54330/m.90311 type:complete len:598 (+) Transcript_54330:176-1969(+)